MNKYLQILFFLILTQSGYSQFFPKEKAEVNYRLVGFEVPIKVNIAKYTLEIADDIITDEEIFSKNIRIVNSSDKNKRSFYKKQVEVKKSTNEEIWYSWYEIEKKSINQLRERIPFVKVNKK